MLSLHPTQQSQAVTPCWDFIHTVSLNIKVGAASGADEKQREYPMNEAGEDSFCSPFSLCERVNKTQDFPLDKATALVLASPKTGSCLFQMPQGHQKKKSFCICFHAQASKTWLLLQGKGTSQKLSRKKFLVFTFQPVCASVPQHRAQFLSDSF